MTKQKRDQKNLKENLIFISSHFDEYVSKEKRLNYLMSIAISCKEGEFALFYGSDPVAEENKKFKKELAKLRKKKKT